VRLAPHSLPGLDVRYNRKMHKEKLGLLSPYLSMVLLFATFPIIEFWAMLFPILGLGIYFILPHRSVLPRPKTRHFFIMFSGGVILAFALWALNLPGDTYFTYLPVFLPMMFIFTYQLVLQLRQIKRIEQDGDANGITSRC
jgi:hypothetical protein